jgi:hypothetical protein
MKLAGSIGSASGGFLSRCASGPPPSASSLLLDALDPDHAEAGVFAANV